MKKILIILGLITILFTAGNQAASRYYPGGHFYSSLQHYGRWIEMDDGLVVWQPRVMYSDWQPYSEGEWVWTENGWYWDSYEPFGYIVYHYGRWYNDEYYGWIWVPDEQWGPAWVEWRYDDDYIGWAPLSPYAIFNVNVGIHFSRNYYTLYNYWHFVNYDNFCTPGMYKHYVGPQIRERIYGRTKYRSEYDYRGGSVFNRGVDPEDIRKRGRGEIRTREIQRVTDPGEIQRNRGDRNTIRTYIASNEDFSRNDMKDVKFTRGERNSSLDIHKITGRDIQRTEPPVIRKEERQDNREIIRNDSRGSGVPEIRKENNGNGNFDRRNEEKRLGTREEVKINRETPPVREQVRNDREQVRQERNDIRKERTDVRQQGNQNRNEQKIEKRTEQRTERNVERNQGRGNSNNDKKDDRGNGRNR